MAAYLFVHFRERKTPDGEQVYFGLSRDGFCWEMVNGGRPVLWSKLGEKGVRDCTIIRCQSDGIYRIFATDLSLAHNFSDRYHSDWPTVSKNGSKCLSLWESEDLVHWSEQRLISFEVADFGCLWAPDVFYDPAEEDYVLHWSSTHSRNQFGNMAIYYSRTKDFITYTPPALLYAKADAGVIDSAVYVENGRYYLFVKSDHNPERILLLSSANAQGPYERVRAFDDRMLQIEQGLYEGPTCVRLENGMWCLFLDYYGVPGDGQGYVPFLSNSLENGDFVRADQHFSFPYGYKHGTVIAISDEEYDRIRTYRWPEE